MKTEFLEKAEESFDAAKLCFDRGLFNACMNRAYYSALQVAIAALADRGIRRDKIDHKQVQSDFSGELIIRRKVYPAKIRYYLSDMQLVRNIADYTGEKISRKLASRWLSKAEEFLGFVKKEIGK